MKTAKSTKRRLRTLFSAAIFLLTFGALFGAVGCASRYAESLKDVRRDLYDLRDVDLARADLERRQKRAPKKEQDVLALNAAWLDLCDGNVDAAKAKMLDVRDRFDALEAETAAKKASENVLALWTDDNATSYPGEDYEKVTLRALLAITDLLGDGGDARAFATQVAAKQDEIVRGGEIPDPNDPEKTTNPKTAYPRIPLGPYLEGLLYEETYLNQNDAARSYEKVVQWRPDFEQGKIDLERARTGVHSSPGCGRLYVFAFVGRGPWKEQRYSDATQISLLIADQIFSATNKYSVPPTLAPVPIPEIVVEEPNFPCVGIAVDGQKTATTETIFDVNETALRQFNATKDQTIARAVVRRIVKKSSIYVAKEVGKVNEWASLAADVGGVVWEATETADTRCWGLLPAQIQVASFELPVGDAKIALYPANEDGEQIGAATSVNVRILSNRNVYVAVNFPDRDPIGRVVSSSPSSTAR